MIRGSFLARRVSYSRLLLATVLLTVLATVALGAALASFAAQSLPQAVRGQPARSPALSIAIHRAISAPQVGPVGRLVRAGIGVSGRIARRRRAQRRRHGAAAQRSFPYPARQLWPLLVPRRPAPGLTIPGRPA